jgi:CheY-specific phosphatase CheX
MTTVSCAPRDRVLTTLVDCVRDAVLEILPALGVDALRFSGERESDAPGDGVYGIISFVGDPCWSFMLGLPRETAAALVERFTGGAVDPESADMADAIGEVANIISGDLVARLEAPLGTLWTRIVLARPEDATARRGACPMCGREG